MAETLQVLSITTYSITITTTRDKQEHLKEHLKCVLHNNVIKCGNKKANVWITNIEGRNRNEDRKEILRYSELPKLRIKRQCSSWWNKK